MHVEKCHNLHAFPNTIEIVKLRGWVGPTYVKHGRDKKCVQILGRVPI